MVARNKVFSVVLAATVGVGLGSVAQAAGNYPERPITLVVPYAPGGPTDTAGRILAQGLQEATGATVVVENAPGAGATIGSGQVSRAKPDGYTLLWGGKSTHSIAPHLRPDLPYDPFRSFEPVAMVGSQPYVVAVRTESPWQSVDDLVAAAKAAPGRLNFSSAGIGSSPHLAGELFATGVGIDVAHIPYKGGSPAMMAVLSGEVDYYLDTPTLPKIQADAGKVRLLASATAERLADMPEVPTLKELGYDNLEIKTWFGIFAPAGTPSEVVEWLNTKINDVLADQRVSQRLVNAGFDVEPMNTSDFRQHLESEHERWGKIIHAAQITLE